MEPPTVEIPIATTVTVDNLSPQAQAVMNYIKEHTELVGKTAGQTLQAIQSPLMNTMNGEDFSKGWREIKPMIIGPDGNLKAL
jgi:hypothetical protein